MPSTAASKASAAPSALPDMSVLRRETVQAIADSIGVNLKDDAVAALLQDTEYRLREIIHEAQKFARHAHRSRLLSDDITAACKVRSLEPLYGFGSWVPPRRFAHTAADAAISSSGKLFYLEDAELDLSSLIAAALPAVPRAPELTVHWLAVHGVQPRILQNPTPAEAASRLGVASGYPSGGLVSAGANVGVPPLSAPLSVGHPDPTVGGMALSAVPGATGATGAAAGGTTTPSSLAPSTAPLVKDVLSREMQLYFEKITTSFLSPDGTLTDSAAKALASDPGLQPLVPYFLSFITARTAASLRDLPTLWRLFRMLRCLLANSNVFLQSSLHAILPTVLTGVVARRLCAKPQHEDHWALRAYAARILAYMASKAAPMYPTLQPRVAKTLLRGLLDPSRSVGTVYGALLGLAGLGDACYETLVIPNLRVLCTDIDARAAADAAADAAEAQAPLPEGADANALTDGHVPAVKPDHGAAPPTHPPTHPPTDPSDPAAGATMAAAASTETVPPPPAELALTPATRLRRAIRDTLLGYSSRRIRELRAAHAPAASTGAASTSPTASSAATTAMGAAETSFWTDLAGQLAGVEPAVWEDVLPASFHGLVAAAVEPSSLSAKADVHADQAKNDGEELPDAPAPADGSAGASPISASSRKRPAEVDEDEAMAEDHEEDVAPTPTPLALPADSSASGSANTGDSTASITEADVDANANAKADASPTARADADVDAGPDKNDDTNATTSDDGDSAMATD